jgi:hypothetical protein
MISVFTFSIRLISALLIVFGLHLLVLHLLEYPLFNNLIVRSYWVNLVMAFGIYVAMYKLKDTQPNNLGFIFMMGSLVKFGLFFLFFFSTYKADGEMTSLEFSSFFIPYATSLILETLTLSKLLNTLK